MSVKLTGELKMLGVASDGAQTIITIRADDLVSGDITLPNTAQAMDVLGGRVRDAINRTSAMLTAGL